MRYAHEFRTNTGKPQKRIHGSPYWLHPYSVAETIAFVFGIRNVVTLRKGLFHDLGEDTTVSLDEIAKRSGHDIANSVCRLTKDKWKLAFKEKRAKTIAYYQGMIDWQFDDLVVKLADRYHNLSELRFGDRDWQINYLADTGLLLTAIRRAAMRQPDLMPFVKMVKTRYWLETQRIIEEEP